VIPEQLLIGWELGVLGAVAFFSAILSAVIGMGGGMTLLVVLLLFVDPLVAIPLHGVIQLLSNSSRATIQREHLSWGIVGRFSLLLLPAGFLGILLAQGLPREAVRMAIGAFVLIATWAPGLFKLPVPEGGALPTHRFTILGGVAGTLNTTIGATGPLIAPFYLGLGLSRQAIIGTKAACQTFGHLAKIVVFGATGFAFLSYVVPLALLGVAVVLGTWVGSKILDRVDEAWFLRLYRLVLTLLAARLVFWEGVKLIA